MNLTEEQIEAKRKEIREGNDLFRKTLFPEYIDVLKIVFPFYGKVILTDGVRIHPLHEEIIAAVREFNDFDVENDPHREHDFGSVQIGIESCDFYKKGTSRYEKFFFKIDYYDLNLEFGADPYQEPFRRALTIMKANEY